MKSFSEYLAEAYQEFDGDDIIHIDEKTLKALLELVKSEDDDDFIEKIVDIIKKVSHKFDDHRIIYDRFGLIRNELYPPKEDDKDDKKDDEEEDRPEQSEDQPESSSKPAEVPECDGDSGE